MFHIETIPCGCLKVNCYILHAEGKTEAVAIDPAAFEEVNAYLSDKGLRLTHILLTHGHFDHVGGVYGLKKAYGAKVYIHAADADMLTECDKIAQLFGERMHPCEADVCLREEESVDVAGMLLHVLHTPGHTPGGVCYRHKESLSLFTGDTLFRLSVGRTDLPDGDQESLEKAIREKLFSLPGDYTIYPGHMRLSTLHFEREHNPYVRM